MEGGGNRGEDSPVKINSTNVFPALEIPKENKNPEWWSVTSLNEKTWADVATDEEDDFYYPNSGKKSEWSVTSLNDKTCADVATDKEDDFYYPRTARPFAREESGIEDEVLSIEDDEEDSLTPAESVPMKLDPAPPVPAAKRQLPKKELVELKKKCRLAEVGLNGNNSKNEECNL